MKSKMIVIDYEQQTFRIFAVVTKQYDVKFFLVYINGIICKLCLFMENYQGKSQEERWQESEDERLEYEGYCRKISQGLESQTETSGIRAIWELIQNARDSSKHNNAIIKIELNPKSLIFSHHGEPFDYTSFRALVKQDSAKDRTDTDTVGQYGTGFMTTHTFNRLVYVSAPFAVKRGKDEISGYVQIKDFELDRRKVDTPEGPRLMKKQLEEVREFWKRPQLPIIEDEATTFRYDLDEEQVKKVSSNLDKIVMLIPFVLILNKTIHKIEVEDKLKHYIFRRIESEMSKVLNNEGWAEMTETISMFNCKTGKGETFVCKSLKSNNGDVVIIPPYPDVCRNVKNIPSLFLWFPLLGTESFGVNFIFHSKRFYPVEKRNNIMLPGISQISKEKGVKNEMVLKEMMDVLFDYYKNEEHAKELSIDMCHVAFPIACENEETVRFYREMQEMWNRQIPGWKVLDIDGTSHSIDEQNVKLLHPDFYTKLDESQRREYEPVIAHYISLVKSADGSDVLIPSHNLIEWSEIVSRWNCDRDAEFFITVADVCKAIKDNSDELFSFLMLLKDSGNSKMMEDYPLLPNRNGQLRKRGDLYYGDFMDNDVFNLVCTVMGDDAAKMYDPQYLKVSEVNTYSKNNLYKDIKGTIDSWRSRVLDNNSSLTDNQLDALIKFCSATAMEDFKNQRGKIMRILPEFYDRVFSQVATIKFRDDDEEEFYKPAFNLLLDYTLSQICKKDTTWVVEHKEWLLRFLQEYAPKDNEGRKKKLDTYGVLPNQNAALYLLSSLKANNGVPIEMADIYQEVFGKDLKDEWVDPTFETLVEFPIVTPIAVAQEIEAAIVADMKQDTHQFEKVVRKIILKIGGYDDWKEWFGQIDDKKAHYTFNMKTGDAQKSLFSLMDNLDDEHLGRLAKLGEEGDISSLIDKLETIRQQEMDSAARFNHLHTIGKHIEDVLRDRIGKDVVSITMPEDKDDKVDVDDIQDGQDIIVKVLKNEEWHNILFIEVKSKWDFNEAAHMSMRQVRMASLHPDEYALCCVDLRPYKDQDLANLSESIILAATKVKMDIGRTLFPMMSGILDADKQPDETYIKISEYRSNIPAKVFEVGEPFEKLLEKIERKAKEKLE